MDDNVFEQYLLKGINKEWYPFFDEERTKLYYSLLISNLNKEYQNNIVYPLMDDVFRLFKLVSLAQIKVVIIGQDPYHSEGVADGLAFSTRQEKIPPSLRNIFKELNNDLNIDNSNPNLESWVLQGVFLLNSILSVKNGLPKSHHNIGWNDFIVNLLQYIDTHCDCIFVLWGKQAQLFKEYLKNGYIIEGAHPSPLAGKAFFNKNYFSKINEILSKNKIKEIDWKINNK
jgi:uracil-DNA glycosylase